LEVINGYSKGFLLKLAGRILGNSGILYLIWWCYYNQRIPKAGKIQTGKIQKNKKDKKEDLDLIMNKR